MRSEKAGGPHHTSVLTPELLAEYWPEAGERLVTALCAYGVDTATAEDAVAEAVTRALGRQLLVDNLEHFCRWAFVVARNIAVDTTRRTRLMVLVDEMPDAPADYNLTEHAESRVRWQETTDAIRSLSAMDRAALLGELESPLPATRREMVKQAVRRHRARARLRHALGQLGGWLGWLRRPTWPWPSLPSASLEGLAALALLPLLAGSAVDIGVPGAGGQVALPTLPAATSGTTRPGAVPAAVLNTPQATARPATSVAPVDSPSVDETVTDLYPFRFTPSPSYDEDKTVYASGGASCSPGTPDSCSRLFVSHDGGGTWRLLPARGRDVGRILLPPSYPRDPRIFSASLGALSVSTDGGETFVTLATTTGPAAMSPLFSAGDPRIVIGSDRNVPSAVPLQYRDGASTVTPLALPLPPTAIAMELWFGGNYATDGRMFVGVMEAVGLPDPAEPRVASIPALYTCVPGKCTRVVEFFNYILPPKVTWSIAKPDTVFVGSTGTLHRSTDGGASFQRLALPLGDRPQILTALVASPDGRLYAKVSSAGTKQLLASDDDGVTWELLDDKAAAFWNLAVLPDGRLIEGVPAETRATTRCSADGGHTWSSCA